jgi:1-acyl-sn-glycerol-3-phosphate acyltransferase
MRKKVGALVLKAARWNWDGTLPDEKKFVLIAAPHTSNWDFVLALSALDAMGCHVSWMGKDSLFRGPAAACFRAMGGIPVNRTKASNLVESMVRQFEERERFVLLVPAEGTRSVGKHWKSGFYYIARGARVPIALGYLDYARKRAGIGPLLWPTGNVKDDMDQIRRFYADKVGKHPNDFTPPVLREEESPLSSPRFRTV